MIKRILSVVVPFVSIGVIAVQTAQAAPFGAFTTNPTSSWAGSPYFSCASTIGSTSPAIASTIAFPLSEPSGTTVTDVSGNARNGTYAGTGRSYSTPAPCLGDGGRAITFNGTNAYAYNNTAFAVPTTMTEAVWFKTSSTSGGTLFGFANKTDSSMTAYDRMLYMNNAGKLYFAVYTDHNVTINSTAAYNDNAWHYAAVTVSSTGTGGTNVALQLFVDGTSVASTTVTGAAIYPISSGYFLVGWTTLSGWAGVPTNFYFNGSLSFATVYTSVLSAAQIADVMSGAGGPLVLEGEYMSPTGGSRSPGVQGSCCGTTFRSGYGSLLSATAAGEYVTYQFIVPTAGTYTLSVNQVVGPALALNTVAVDGTTVGAPFDGYASAYSVPRSIPYVTKAFSAGAHTLTLSITGKNASASNYYLLLDYITLTQ